jgi:glycine/D-amino acid oxidase-like deaminating enzyme
VGDKQIIAKNVVITTYSPWQEPWHLYFKKALYRSYVLELEAPGEVLADGLYEDLSRPYHYSRVVNRDGKCQIIFGGEDHREDLKLGRAKNYHALLNHAEKFFSTPELKVVRRWSGQLLESIDGLPYIGQDQKSGLYYAFAFSGNGLTYSAIAASLLGELITNKVGLMSPFQSLYRVNRWPKLKALLIKGRDYGWTFVGGALKNIFS